MNKPLTPIDDVTAEMAAKERASCADGFTIKEVTDRQGRRRWLVLHPLPASSPYGRAYLLSNGEWSTMACYNNADDAVTGYFRSDLEARAAMRRASPPQIRYNGNAVRITSRRPWWSRAWDAIAGGGNKA